MLFYVNVICLTNLINCTVNIKHVYLLFKYFYFYINYIFLLVKDNVDCDAISSE